ncbi:MAG: hypothetical protein ABIG90_00525 [bacterium]
MKKIITTCLFLGICFLFLVPVQAEELGIDLNWHSSTLVPDWYKGRALPVRGSTLTVSAITNQKNLIYDWYLDRNYIKYSSGLNRDSFSFVVTEWPGYEHNIRVKVGDSYASTSIKVQEPKVHLGSREYILKPGQTKSFQAIPYFFTSSNLKYQWFVNNEEIKNNNADIFTLDVASGSGSGTNKLDILIRNPNNLLERAQERVAIQIK